MSLTQITTGGVDDNINIDSNTLKVDGTNNRVGIGTSSPGLPLDIVSNVSSETVRFRGASGGVGTLRFTSNDAGTNYAFIQSRSTFFDIGSSTSIPLLFSTNGTERMRIDSSGKVGIGTTSPAGSLHVDAASGVDGAVFDSGGTGNTNHALLVRDSGNNQLLRVNNNGNVGIGTSSPSTLLDVNGNVQFGDGGGFDMNINGTRHQFSIGGSEKMRIDSSGRVFFNETSSDLGHKYIFSGNESADVAAFQYNSNTGTYLSITTGAPNGNVELKADARSGSFPPLVFKTGANERMRLVSTGKLLLNTSSELETSTHAKVQIASTGGGHICLGRNDNSISSGNDLGLIRFYSNDGGSYQEAARIEGEADGDHANDDKPGRLVFGTTADGASFPTERMRIRSNGDLTTTTDASFNRATAGFTARAGDSVSITRNNGTPLEVNRTASDGTLINFFQAGSAEGSITVSGQTVSYNGAHLSRWSQLAGGATRIEILRGSVLSNLDELCEWAYDAQDAVLYTEEDELPEGASVGDVKTPAVAAGTEDNEQLNRMKISDVEGDRNVSGVFQAWDDDDDTYVNDFYCAMTGDFVIRIAQGTTVARGDLLMSAGDGTAKPQDDDIVRSKTIAKVTSTTVSTTYADNSYCVPCVLMAC